METTKLKIASCFTSPKSNIPSQRYTAIQNGKLTAHNFVSFYIANGFNPKISAYETPAKLLIDLTLPPVISLDELPLFTPMIRPKGLFATTSSEARKLLKLVSPYASKDVLRYHLNTVYFYPEKSCLVATDGHRLAEVSTPEQTPCKPFLIPIETANRIVKALNIIPKDTPVRFNVDDYTNPTSLELDLLNYGNINCRLLVDDQFPYYQKVIPEESELKTFVKLNTKELDATLKKLKPFLSNENKSIALRFDANNVQITATQLTVSSYCASFEGKPITIMLNHTYLSTAVASARQSKAQWIDMQLTEDPLRIITLHWENAIILIMPLRKE